MAQQIDDDDIVGLKAARQKLPTFLRQSARHEFWRAIFDDGYAELVGPQIIHYRNCKSGKLRTALLILVRCENFIFDLFLVKNRESRYVPIVGRAYLDNQPHFGWLYNCN